jgi:hypothetical protein
MVGIRVGALLNSVPVNSGLLDSRFHVVKNLIDFGLNINWNYFWSNFMLPFGPWVALVL